MLMIAFVLAVLHYAPAQAQSSSNNLSFRRISVEQGLSQSTPYVILQDRTGFLWIGTSDGLNRYDGYTFRVYRHIPSDSTSLSDNFVQALCEDAQGNLWVGTRDGGLNKLDARTGRFTTYKYNPANPHSISSNYISSIALGAQGELWIGTEGGGVTRFDPASGSTTVFQHNPNKPLHSLSSNLVLAICVDHAGNVWLGTGDAGLSRFNPRTGVWTTFQHNSNDARSLSHNTVRAMLEDRSGTLWIGTEGGGVNRFDATTETFTQYRHSVEYASSLSNDAVHTLLEDKYGAIWVGTVDGLNRFERNANAGKGAWTVYREQPNSRRSISGNTIFSLFQDRTDLLWIGVYGGGLNTVDMGFNAFTTHNILPNLPKALGAVFSICEDRRGNVWVSSRELGLLRFESGDNNRKVLANSDIANAGITRFRHNPADTTSISSDAATFIYETRDGTLWVATQNGLNRFEPQQQTFTRFLADTSVGSLSNNSIFTLFEDKNHMLWIGTLGGGLNRFNPITHSFTTFKYDPRNPRSLSNNVVRSVCEDSSGTLWIGTRGGGLNRFNPQTQDFTRFLHDERNPKSLSHNAIFALHIDRVGTLWVGTQGGGLNRFNPQTQDFTAFQEKDGLANNVVYGILEDAPGNLWLSTNKGVSKMVIRHQSSVIRHQSLVDRQAADAHSSPMTNAPMTNAPMTNDQCIFRNYDVRDGLQSNEFNAGAYHKGQSGRFYLGGIRGMNEFYPDSVRDNPHVPPIVITTFKRFNDEIPLPTILMSDTLSASVTLSYRDNFFSFEFAALDFILPEKNRYRYKLESFNDTWIDAGTRHEASYTDVDPGEYVFRVQGSNNDGVWNEQGAILRVVILPPFWRTWWFRTLVIVLIVGVVAGFMIWRIRTVRFAETLRREMAQLELQSLRLHMNPHFIFNSINSIQYLISEGDAKAAMRYLSTFASLMRRILKQTDHLHISIADEIELLTMYIELEQLRYDYTFSYELHCPQLNEIRHVFIPAMVIQPYVENAIRHGLGTRSSNGKVLVVLESHPNDANALRCVVEDNGIGREKAQELQKKAHTSLEDTNHLSIATTVTQRRLELLNTARSATIGIQYTDLHDADGGANGTRVEIHLPIL